MKSIAFRKKNICDKKAEVKLAFCHEFLPMDYLGFEFVSWNENKLTCVAQPFWLAHLHKHISDSYKLKMYPCPDMKYRDLKTNEDVIVDRKYHVSEGIKHDSAIVFFQKNKNDKRDKIYPKKYINNIIFKQLTPPKIESKIMMRPMEFSDKKFIEYEITRRIRERKLFLIWDNNRRKKISTQTCHFFLFHT